ncbi:MAG: DUF389 domain-containing protein, partial [Verrucomicrobiota bacterium]
FAALVIGTICGFVAPIDTLTSELAARGGPNLLDLGVAALSGIAASYCIVRPGLSSALAGVAIAAALVPPIATVGISLALREWPNALGAALLFGTNVVAIILASAATFFAMGIRGQIGAGKLWVRRTIGLLVLALGLLVLPLSTVLVKKTTQAVIQDGSDQSVTEVAERILGNRASSVRVLQRSTTDNGSEQFRLHVESVSPLSKGTVQELARGFESELKLEKVRVLIENELVISSDE